MKLQRNISASQPVLQQQHIAAYSKDEDVRKFIQSLKNSSARWNDVSSLLVKQYVVYVFITEYKNKGVKISKHPGHYVNLINDLTSRNPGILSNPFNKVLETVAIIEYDFDNGQDKDAMAKKILGEDGAFRNKQRLGIQ